jgi:hypothetical protein
MYTGKCHKWNPFVQLIYANKNLLKRTKITSVCEDVKK